MLQCEDDKMRGSRGDAVRKKERKETSLKSRKVNTNCTRYILYFVVMKRRRKEQEATGDSLLSFLSTFESFLSTFKTQLSHY